MTQKVAIGAGSPFYPPLYAFGRSDLPRQSLRPGHKLSLLVVKITQRQQRNSLSLDATRMETYETSLFQTQGGAAHSSSSSEKLLVSAPTSPRASESHAGARRSTRRESQTEFAAAFDDEDTAQQKNPGPKPPPLAGYHGYESLNYDHIYNTFQMEDAIARQSHTKEVYGYTGKATTTNMKIIACLLFRAF